LTLFGQYLVQYYFAALGGKRFLLRDIARDLLVFAGMHVPTLSSMISSVAVACFRLMRTSTNYVIVLFTLHSFATAH